jgi:hypothetical protein
MVCSYAFVEVKLLAHVMSMVPHNIQNQVVWSIVQEF